MPRPRASRLTPRLRRALLTAHIVASVALLGDIGGFLAVAIQAQSVDDPGSHYDVLALFSVAFGIPLSFTALITGVVLSVRGKWGLLRYPWVTIKLVLLLSVILVGAFVLGPGVDAMRRGEGGTEALIVAGASWDLFALLLSTGLSVYKPGRPRSSTRRHPWRRQEVVR